MEGWQQRSHISKCDLCWGNQKEPCGDNPLAGEDGNEDQQWVADPKPSLPDYCPSCNNTARTSSESLLSVPLIFQQFNLLIQQWASQDFRDVTEEMVQEMHADRRAARAQYNLDTLQGPWNNAEGNLRAALQAYQEKWESIIMLAKQDRHQQAAYNAYFR